MTIARQRFGRSAEERVAGWLERQGVLIVDRNARPADVRGEIDLVALDADVLVFVEVKARRAGSVGGPETPALAVGLRKQARLRRLATAWLRENRERLGAVRALRFDVAGLRLDDEGRLVEWEYLRAAF